MQRAFRILIVGSDPRLQVEAEAALNSSTKPPVVIQYAPDFRQGVEFVRSHHSDFALVEMSAGVGQLKAFSDEVAAWSPETIVAAVVAPELFGPEDSESALLIRALRAGVHDFLMRPLSRTDLQQLLERFAHRPGAEPVKCGRVVTFMSNKGGVGKSTLAVNSACGLAVNYPERVLLIDASLQMGVCDALLNAEPETSLTDAARELDRLDATLLRQLATPHECGLHLLAAPADAVEAAAINDNVLSRVLMLARRAYDYVLVDTFPLLDRVVMAALDVTDRAYIVIESIVPAVLGAARLLRLLDSLGVPQERQRIVLNRYTGATDNLKAEDVAQRLNRDIDHVVPYQRRLTVAANIGEPYVLGASRLWGCGKALYRLMQDIESIDPHRRASVPQGTPGDGAAA